MNDQHLNMIDCYSCHTEITSISLFCYQCGVKVSSQLEIEEKRNTLLFIKELGKRIVRGTLNNLYLILLFTSVGYFIWYNWAYYAEDSEGLRIYNMKKLSLWKDLALLIFSGGIFTASLKYLQYIKVFEKEFDRILMSDKYNNRLKKSIESITLSEDYFLKQNNLEHIWEIVTLSKYRKNFPDIYSILKKNIKNELFEKNNISYYYKNQSIVYTITKVDVNTIKIVEETNYTIVRNTKSKFNWDFRIRVTKEDSNEGEFPKIDFSSINSNGIVFDPIEDVTVSHNDAGDVIKEIKKDLFGQEEYHIRRVVTLNQNLEVDREYVVGCDRIIDDLTITIRNSKDLTVIFSPSSKVKYYNEDSLDLGKFDEITYFNRDLLLPGEKFKLFFIKKELKNLNLAPTEVKIKN